MNFFRRYQKLFSIIIFLGISFLLAYLIWLTFFKSTEETPENISKPGIISGLPEMATGTKNIIKEIIDGYLPDGSPSPQPGPSEVSSKAEGGLTKTEKISKDKAINPTISSDGKVQYYNFFDGKFYKIDKNGNTSLLSDRYFPGVDSVTWSPNKDKAILEYPDGKKILYNFDTKKQATLPSHWVDFSFSSDGSQLSSKSIGNDPINSWLVVSNDDGSKARAVEHIGTNHNIVYPAWSANQQIVALYTKGVDFNRQEVFFLGQNEENFKSTIIEGRGFEFKWSNNGEKLLYSVWNTDDNLNPRLWIVDASVDKIGNNRKNLELQTWASKCNFASPTDLYCAVPESLPQGAGLFPELADRTKDLLYKIDLKTGAKKLLAVPDGSFNISEIMVPSDQKTLFFTDKSRGEIYKIDL